MRHFFGGLKLRLVDLPGVRKSEAIVRIRELEELARVLVAGRKAAAIFELVGVPGFLRSLSGGILIINWWRLPYAIWL